MRYAITQNAFVSNDDIDVQLKNIGDYHHHLKMVAKTVQYQESECSLSLVYDSNILKQVGEIASSFSKGALQYIFVIGIGGSNLGTKAIYDALYGSYDILHRERVPKIIFLDTQDASFLHQLMPALDRISSKESFVINAISKSGGTTETAVNLEVLVGRLSQRFGDIHDRLVFTTDADSKMYKKAKELHINTLTLPSLVGGRYSVFSSVGLFPLLLAGIQVEKLLEGARSVLQLQLEAQDLYDNHALLSAITLYHHSTKGVNINDTFIFLPQLESLGKWYRQLMGESLGKEGKGITPTVSIGSTDLHSVGQLYLGGPKDKITTFIYHEHPSTEIRVPATSRFHLVDELEQRAVGQIMDAIVQGTMKAYTTQRIPYMSIGFDDVSEFALGEYMQFKMLEMMYLGKLMQVNAFDQPHVELYKAETRKILKALR